MAERDHCRIGLLPSEDPVRAQRTERRFEARHATDRGRQCATGETFPLRTASLTSATDRLGSESILIVCTSGWCEVFPGACFRATATVECYESTLTPITQLPIVLREPVELAFGQLEVT
jgi:hypothetical protein